MRVSLEEALALAEEARANGHLNKFPQACIALADAIYELRKERNDSSRKESFSTTQAAARETADDPNTIP